MKKAVENNMPYLPKILENGPPMDLRRHECFELLSISMFRISQTLTPAGLFEEARVR